MRKKIGRLQDTGPAMDELIHISLRDKFIISETDTEILENEFAG